MRRAETTWQQQLLAPWAWHRWLGIGAAVVLVWVAVTGLVLVHASDLGLAQRPVTTRWVLDMFGVPTPTVEVGHHAPFGWVAQAGDRVFVDGVVLPAQLGALVGVYRADDAVLVAGSDAQLVLDPHGAVLELLPPDADPALGALTPLPAEPLPDATRTAIATAARSTLLDWEQVLRVLHGSHGTTLLGKLVADLSALALLVLSLTGISMFIQRRRRNRKRAAQQEREPPRKQDGDGEE